jgi:prepilin-type N-terminal cleavage/methylation domain-containing protein
MGSPRLRRPRTAGFTLVELLIVVVILAILATVVLPQFDGVTDETKQARFASSLRVLAEACALYEAKTGEHVVDVSSGVWQAELDGYVQQASFEKPTPVGGVWDTEQDDFGAASAVGVHFLSGDVPSDAFMEAVDALLDDGVLTSGGFRKLDADRFYMILAW